MIIKKVMNFIASVLILLAIIQSILIFISLIGWLRGADNVLFPGLGLIVTLPTIIVFLLIFNIVLVVAAAIIKPHKDFVVEKKAEQKFEYPSDIFGDCGNGVLDLSIAKNPDNWGQHPKDRHLDVCLHGDDLEAIFSDTLHTDEVEYEKYTEGKNSVELHERNRKLFQQSIPEYPMLGRIYDIYEDYVFKPEEVKKLREECFKVKSSASSQAADLALRKLIYACDEALKDDLYLMFLSD